MKLEAKAIEWAKQWRNRYRIALKSAFNNEFGRSPIIFVCGTIGCAAALVDILVKLIGMI